MTTRFRFASLSFFVMLIAFMFAPIVKADQWNKETFVTFSRAVEVPGQVLPAGKYIFKIAESQSDRHIVQIFNQDRKLMTTILASPDYRLEPTDKTVISMRERPSGSPEAVGSWFYPGDNYGSRFVYPDSTMDLASNSQPPIKQSPTPKTTAESVPPAVETFKPATQSSVVQNDIQNAGQNDDRRVLAQNAPVQRMASAPATLPKTAGNFFTVPLVGFGLLCAGLTLLRFARQEN
jgi:uncharacterized surface anchored protein